MQRLIYTIFLVITLSSCEDVIEVKLKTVEPRLVIDASLNWVKRSTGSTQTIQLSLTAPYFNSDIPPATGAIVSVADSNNNTFNFIEEGNTGIYKTDTFIPVNNNNYFLTIHYENETYTAVETLTSVPDIEFVEQKNDEGFSGEEIEIKAYYTDPKNTKDFYLFEFINNTLKTISLEVYDDEFTEGNKFFALYTDENLEYGDELIIRNSGISERTYHYLNILLQQSDDENGDPFATQPTLVRGNCINQTNPSNYPVGYFRISEVSIFRYIIE